MFYDVFETMSKSVSKAIRDKKISNWICDLVILNIEEYRFLRGVHYSEMGSNMIVFRHSSQSEIKEPSLCSRDVNLHSLCRNSLCHKHIMICHNNAITCIES